MRRLVIDTSLYIDWLNRGLYEEVLFQRDAVKYLSAVVLMELRAGAFRPADRRVLDRLQGAFERAGRLLAPTRNVFADAGDTLRGLQAQGYDRGAGRSIVSDVLIALSARSIGATVVTRNERDYRAIAKVRPFRLSIVS
jgi:predicted nucleic acid-binding protein